MDDKIQNLKEFLLGGLSEVDSDPIDAALIDGLVDFGDLSRAEEDLIEDFLERRLSANDIRRFRENFLASAKHRENLIEITALRAVARDEFSEPGADTIQAHLIRKEERGFLGLFLTWPRALAGGLALCAIVALATLIWIGYGSRNSSDGSLRVRYQEINNGGVPDPNQVPPDSIATLFPGKPRSAAAGAPNRLATGDGDLLLRLSLPYASNGIFKVTVSQSGRDDFWIDNLKAKDQEVRTLLPRSVFAIGEATVTLNEPGSSSLPIVYYLRVE